MLALGGLELSGKILPARGTYAALTTAKAYGIKYAIVSKDCEVRKIDGLAIICVENLKEAYDKLCSLEEYEAYEAPADSEEIKITFTESEEGSLDTIHEIRGENAEVVAGMKYAMAVAAAGRHNIIAIGSPGCGKTMLLQRLFEITPNFVTKEDAYATTRIWSLAGLLRPNTGALKSRPFRMPHQTASIEGICGGGPDCRPGEISLAHGGTLFLDEAAEFRSSVLQMLRVPLESHQITLSRAGRNTVFPADFQLVMATNPCPCGNYGSKTKICLCSAKSIDQYWKKFSAPLLDRVDIRYFFDGDYKLPTSIDLSLKGIRAMVKKAWETQYKRQGKLNRDLTSEELLTYAPLSKDVALMLDRAARGSSPRAIVSIEKLARTVADMNGLENIDADCMSVALELHRTAATLPLEL